MAGELAIRIRPQVRFGSFLIGVFILGFGLWASFAPLANGVSAVGALEPTSPRHTIQDPRGGIVETMLVREGETVVAGQVLLKLAENPGVMVELKAPVNGTVTGLRVNTEGVTVNPGEAIMQITPSGVGLILMAQVRPDEAADVQPGLPVYIHFPGLKRTGPSSIGGTVEAVSADRSIDPRNGMSYYPVRIKLDPQELRDHPEIKLLPGMPAEAMIETGHTTIARYGLAPLLDTFRRAAPRA